MCTVPGCGKRFTEYSSLYKHHVVHTHCKPYTCNHCGKTYRQTSTLAMHKRTTHGDYEPTDDGEAEGRGRVVGAWGGTLWVVDGDHEPTDGESEGEAEGRDHVVGEGGRTLGCGRGLRGHR